MAELIWLITGCSSGFGSQLTQSVLATGDHVIATARTLSSIEHLLTLGATTLQLDVTSSQNDINEVMAKAINVHGRIDVLVNNAAYVQIGLWEDLEYDDWLKQFDTNVFGTIKVTKSVLPHLRSRRQGIMVFISSLNGFVGHPAVGPYSASKHALEGAVESLANETASLGLQTLLIEPGRFRTKLLSSNNLKVKSPASKSTDYRSYYDKMFPAVSNEDGRQPGDPEKLVSILIDLVRQEGVAKNRERPFRMLLGRDAHEEVGQKLRETLRTFEDWEKVTLSTDVERQYGVDA